MNPRLTLACIFVVLQSTVLSQPPQEPNFRGTVVDVKNKPIAGAEILREKAMVNPDITDQEGNFALLFPNKKPGDRIDFKVSATGYETVNENELYTFIPRNAKLERARIVMCPVGLLDQARIAYFKISVKNIERRHREEVAKLDQRSPTLQDEVTILEAKRDDLISKLGPVSERLSRISLTQLSNSEKLALDRFSEGKVDEALAILSKHPLKAQVANAMAKRDELLAQAEEEKKKLDALKNMSLLKADLFVANYLPDSAQVYYQLAAESDTTDYQTVRSFADFLHSRRGEDEKALKWYKNALALAVSKEDIIEILTNIAELQGKVDIAAAGAAYKVAFDEIDKLKLANDPDTVFLPQSRGILLINYAHFLHRIGKRTECHIKLDEAIEQFKRLQPTDPYLSDLGEAAALQSKAYLIDINQLDRKINANKIALFLFDKLISQDSAQTSLAMIPTLYNITICLAVKNDSIQEMQYFKRTFDISKRLMAAGTVDYLQNFHGFIWNMGKLHLDMNRHPDRAKYYYKIAAEYYETLKLPDIDPVSEIKANVYFRLGETHHLSNDLEAAIPYFEKASVYAAKLVGSNPHYYDSLFNAQHSLGLMNYMLGNDTESRKYFGTAMETAKKTIGHPPMKLATCNFYIALTYVEVDFSISRNHFNEMIRLMEGYLNPNAHPGMIEMGGMLLNEMASLYQVYGGNSEVVKKEYEYILAMGRKLSDW